MSGFQVQNVSSGASLISREVYPFGIYQTADAGAQYNVSSPDERVRDGSHAFTNLVLEILDGEIARPLAQIPGLAERVRVGNFDSDTIQRISEVFDRFPVFAQGLSVGQLGLPLRGTDTLDIAQRAANLLSAKTGNSALMQCGDKPLLGLLAGCILRTTQVPKEAMRLHLTGIQEGSLCHAISIRAIALINEWANRVREREVQAESRLAQAESRLAQSESRRAQSESRLAQANAQLAQANAQLAHAVQLNGLVRESIPQLLEAIARKTAQERRWALS